MTKKQIRPLARLHGYWTYQRFLRRTPGWSRERRERYTIDKLKATLVRANEGVPFYRERFRQAGFNPGSDFKVPSDLARIPLLTKQEVRAHDKEMIDGRYRWNAVEAGTSGTTGEPMTMLLNESYIAFDYATMFRHWAQAGYRFRSRFMALRSYVPKRDDDPLWYYNRPQNTLYMSAYHLSPANADRYVNEVLRFRPEFIRGYPSSLNVFAEFALPHRDQLGFVKGLFTASETLLPSERDTIERTFGKKLFDWYGLTEPVVIMAETNEHDGLRIQWEYGYAELLPSPELPENEYRLIATGFHNPVMPFIRYDTGDVVRLREGTAPDYYAADPPLIDSIAGRKDECIIMPDGRRLPSLNFYTVFREFDDVLKFQIVQFGRAEVLVKVLLRPQVAERERLLAQLRHELLMRFGGECRLDLQVTDQFITNRDGKTPPIVRRPGTRAVEEVAAYASSTQAAWKMEREGRPLTKLDYNEADIAPSPRVRQAIARALESDRYWHWYPENQTAALQSALARYCDVAENNLLVTHGSDMVIELAATAFMRYGDRLLMVHPTYEKVAYLLEERGAIVELFPYLGEVAFPIDAFIRAIREKCPRMVYLSNPNNPIGYSLPIDQMTRILEACEEMGAVLLHDEAYFEFGGVTLARLVDRYRSLVVARTFSKAFGLAGLRLGYLVAHAEVVRLLSRVHNTNHVTMLAREAGLAALEDLPAMRRYVDAVNANKQRVLVELARHGIACLPSDGNFILVPTEDAEGMSEFLKARAIFVRNKTRSCNNLGHVRITIGADPSTERLLAGLADYFAQRATPRPAEVANAE